MPPAEGFAESFYLLAPHDMVVERPSTALLTANAALERLYVVSTRGPLCALHASRQLLEPAQS